MSVINKMLRDLDQRQVPDDNGSVMPGATPLRSGTASVAGVLIPTKASRGHGIGLPAGITVAVLAASGAAGWWWTHQGAAINVAKSAPVAQSAPVVAVALPVSTASAPVAAAASAPLPAIAIAPLANASAAVALAAPPALAASAAAKPLAAASASAMSQAASKPVTIAATNQPPAAVPVAAAALAVAPAAVVIASASKPVPVPDPASIGQRQQQAAREALAQAQTLWNAGAHDNAIDLLQQAVATAERSAQSTPGVPATQALATLARDLARMQVAQGRPGATVDTLTRLEPLLSGDPDIWAVRANAAQRAGRHQESINAYTTALQSRPNEQRWLLGAAVSSAALGQTNNAAALAEKAASVGPLPKDVQAYLRQMGVALKD